VRAHQRKRHQQPPDRTGRVLRQPALSDGPLLAEAMDLMWQAAALRRMGYRIVSIALLPCPRIVSVPVQEPAR
jgi:hypothetical protein